MSGPLDRRADPSWRMNLASNILPHIVGSEWAQRRFAPEVACNLAQELADEACKRWGHTNYVSDGRMLPCHYCGAPYRFHDEGKPL